MAIKWISLVLKRAALAFDNKVNLKDPADCVKLAFEFSTCTKDVVRCEVRGPPRGASFSFDHVNDTVNATANATANVLTDATASDRITIIVIENG